MTDVKVPSVGESINEVFIGAWLKQPGDRVEKDEPLVEVETDKATLEVPASEAGVLKEVLKSEGDSAEVGEVIARIEAGAASGDDAEATEGADAPSDADEPAEDAKPGDAPKPAKPAGGEPAAEAPSGDEPSGDEPSAVMPAARRLLDEHGLSAAAVRATGPGGRLLKEDVQRHLDAGGTAGKEGGAEAGSSTQAQAQAGTAADRREESVAMSPLRRTIARRLVEAQQTAALLTTFNEVDMSEVMALRSEYKDAFEKRYGVRLGFMSFFVKAAIDALKTIPQLNAEIRDDRIVYKDYYDVAVAVSTKKGLVTPVVRDAETMSFAELEAAIADFGARAQQNKLTPDELQGGTFTISNGGVFGSLLSTPIVNPPQSGVLGMHTIQQRPVAIDGQVVIRPMMYLALTYDHRIVDGREAVTFLKRIKDAVERPARMLIEV
ncbi:MAG: 2-oxoglutarate dehydrogenase complex dihydrolipoyllysine-residue succinyltransferase [Trueperaceae bacterium]|nr:2-oxoglutarate dehydrogenase complex dihydrolipoyllysine-residue succinyltransferase [Trueperaceae bacterium]